MRLALLAVSALGGAGCGAGGDTVAIGVEQVGRTLYVGAAVAPGGDGSAAAPFDSLQALEAASAPGDSLIVLPAPMGVPPLDGGIALKAGQRLIGAGPAVLRQTVAGAAAGSQTRAALPRIANTDPSRLQGDAVRLAPDSTVRNLVITESVRGAIYGLNAPGAQVIGNDVSGFNSSCAPGFMVEPFTAPTTGPYFGVPAVLPAGWAGIMLDADGGDGAVSINGNFVHDSACGNGIDLRLMGDADYLAEISGNLVTRLQHGPGWQAQELHLVHAITTQVTDDAQLEALSVDNTQTDIGAPGADCEGLFMNLADRARARWTIDRNRFERGIGGFSCNGMEFIISNGTAHAEMAISNSRFADNPGDMFEQANLGSGSTAILHLDNVEVRDTHERGGHPDDGGLPFNLGECLLTGSTGSGNTTILRIRDSVFSGCNNGLSLLSGLNLASNLLGGVTGGEPSPNPLAPDGLIDVEISGSAFTDNAYSNLVVGVIAGLDRLRLKIENTDFSRAGENAIALRKLYLGEVADAQIDFGGGALGSAGGNCIQDGGAWDVLSEGFAASLQHAWWGRPEGADPARISSSEPLALRPSLSQAPAACGD